MYLRVICENISLYLRVVAKFYDSSFCICIVNIINGVLLNMESMLCLGFVRTMGLRIVI